MRIGIDIDGCVRDIHAKLVQVYNREMKEPYWCDPPEKWGQYEVSPHFSIGKGIYDFWFRAHAEEIYTKSLPYPDLSEIKKLASEGDKIIILTDQPNDKTEAYTLEWINNYIPYAWEKHFTSDKGQVRCDIYLDDAPHHIENIVRQGGLAIVRNHKWNENVKAGRRVRVDSLTEFTSMIREMR